MGKSAHVSVPTQEGAKILPRGVAKRIMARIKYMRQDRSLTQLELARRSGVGVKTVASWEEQYEHVDRMPLCYLFAIAAALGVTPETIIRRD